MENYIRKITGAKIHDTDVVDVKYEEILKSDEGEDKDCITREPKTGKRLAHQDLKDAFAALAMHLAVITEQCTMTEWEDNKAEWEKKFIVTGFTRAGSGEHEGIVLTGQRILEHNQVLNINTPFQKLNTSHATYTYIESFDRALQVLLTELDLNIDGKYAPERQMSLDFDVPAEKPKKASRKKKEKVEAGAESEADEEGADEEFPALKLAANH